VSDTTDQLVATLTSQAETLDEQLKELSKRKHTLMREFGTQIALLKDSELTEDQDDELYDVISDAINGHGFEYHLVLTRGHFKYWEASTC